MIAEVPSLHGGLVGGLGKVMSTRREKLKKLIGEVFERKKLPSIEEKKPVKARERGFSKKKGNSPPGLAVRGVTKLRDKGGITKTVEKGHVEG